MTVGCSRESPGIRGIAPERKLPGANAGFRGGRFSAARKLPLVQPRLRAGWCMPGNWTRRMLEATGTILSSQRLTTRRPSDGECVSDASCAPERRAVWSDASSVPVPVRRADLAFAVVGKCDSRARHLGADAGCPSRCQSRIVTWHPRSRHVSGCRWRHRSVEAGFAPKQVSHPPSPDAPWNAH